MIDQSFVTRYLEAKRNLDRARQEAADITHQLLSGPQSLHDTVKAQLIREILKDKGRSPDECPTFTDIPCPDKTNPLGRCVEDGVIGLNCIYCGKSTDEEN